MNDTTSYGSLVMKIRKEYFKESQQAFAKSVGISGSVLCRIEKGARVISVDILDRIAVRLGGPDMRGYAEYLVSGGTPLSKIQALKEEMEKKELHLNTLSELYKSKKANGVESKKLVTVSMSHKVTGERIAYNAAKEKDIVVVISEDPSHTTSSEAYKLKVELKDLLKAAVTGYLVLRTTTTVLKTTL